MTLVAHNLLLRRGGRAIVDDVSLSLNAGGLVALIGANGAGKSSLLSVLAGLTLPDSGVVTVNGARIETMKPRALAQARAYLPQNARAEWPISVERIVALGLTPHLPTFGDLAAAHREKVAAALAACDLTAQAQQRADTLSGGELARAMLARALVGEPDVLIVDEPMSGLDPRHKLDTIARLTAYARAGKAVICSTHDLTLAARHADRVIAMHQGRVLADGPTAEAMSAETLSTIFEVKARVTHAGSAVALVDFDR